MGTIFAIVSSNLTIDYFEEKISDALSKINPKDFVDFSCVTIFDF